MLLSAPFGRRLLARLLDLLFAFVLTLVVVVAVALVLVPLAVIFGLDGVSGGFLAAFSYFVAYIGLEWFLLIQRDGQTLGKGLMGLRVVNVDTGTPVGPGRGLRRLAVFFVPFALFALAGGAADNVLLDRLASAGVLVLLVSCVLAAVPKNSRRTVHDLAGSTRVVVAPKRAVSLKSDLRLLAPATVSLTKN